MLNTSQKELSELMQLVEVAKFLGLDYFHTRKMLLMEKNLGYFEYGRKRLWKRAEIVAFKERHFKSPKEE